MNHVVGERMIDMRLPGAGAWSSTWQSLWGIQRASVTTMSTAQTASDPLQPRASPIGTDTAPATADMRDIIAV